MHRLMTFNLIFPMVLVVAMGYGLYHVFTTPGLKPVVISVYDPPRLFVDTPVHDLGKVATDSSISHTFYLYNTGGKPLHIDGVETTCGCTVAEISRQVIPPGDLARLTVMLDTSIKLGKVKKNITVYSNDPDNPQYTVYMLGYVQPNLSTHGKMEVKDPLVLFKGECATCHVEKGRGKSGQALFQADCGMCHGLNAQGGVAIPLIRGNYEDPAYLAHVRQVITHGAPHTPTMPPFGKEKGGPLNTSEIDSLVRFLRFQSQQYKEGLLDEQGEPINGIAD